MKRIALGEFGVMLDPVLIVQQKFEPSPRAQPEMVVAFRANFPVFLEIFLPDDRAASLALHPQPFRANAAFVHRGGILDRFFFALEPGHFVNSTPEFFVAKNPAETKF